MVRIEEVGDDYRLQQAWLELRGGRTAAARQQGAGVDGVTLATWEEDWQWRLANLRAELLGGAYRPSPLLWFDLPRRSRRLGPGPVWDGGQSCSRRRLGIPTVTDRVVQRAVKNLLEPIWEREFLSCSHGFRPERSVFTAVAHVLWHEAQGLDWVADADIEACFDSLAHERLLSQVAPTVDDGVLGLIAAWLAAGAAAPGQGVAQGSVISPLLANIYLHPFDEALVGAGLALVRYADDWVVMCRNRDGAFQALDLAAGVLAELELALNREKTGVVPFGPQFRFLGAEFSN
jgi:group II intron reverse transcriptase/maturase